MIRSKKTLALLSAFFAIGLQAVSASAATDCKDDSKFGEVTKNELTAHVEKKSAVVIDVNSADSFKKSHVPGAIHFEANEKTLAKQLPTDKNSLIVAYCGGPKCTAWKKAAQAACEMGYTNVRHYKGGLSGWNEKSS